MVGLASSPAPAALGIAPTHPALAVAALLHAGGAPGLWGNLGLWAMDEMDYAGAAEALADAVARAAGVGPGAAVVSLACGAGEELLRWRQRFGAGPVLGLEREAELVAAARARIAAAGLTRVDALAAHDTLHELHQRPAQFGQVLIVDAAYHLGPRRALFDAAATALKPGGRLAYTDLVLDAAPARIALRAAALLTRVPLAQLGHAESTRRDLIAAGFDEIRIERLDEAVLGGFTRFVRRQRRRLGARARGAAWRRIAITAALIPPCRAAGLGYALISARRSSRA